jgi:translation elongation factor EF-4
MKGTDEARVGDTVYLKDYPIESPLPGFKPIKPLGKFCEILNISSLFWNLPSRYFQF